MNNIRILLIAFCCFFSTMVAADPQVVDPTGMMTKAIDEVLTTLKSNESLYKDNPTELRQRVEKSALPYFNIPRMAQLALGKEWKTADAKQRETFTREFQTYLMRSYTQTLFLYRNTSPKMLAREDNGGEKTVQKISVDDQNGKNVVLFFRLEKSADVWQILDVSVEGISLVVTARGLFTDEINKKGMDGFLQSLTAQNKQAATNAKP